MPLISMITFLAVIAGKGLAETTEVLDDSIFGHSYDSSTPPDLDSENRILPSSILEDETLVLMACDGGIRMLHKDSTKVQLVISSKSPTTAVDYHYKRSEIFFITANQLLRTTHGTAVNKFSTPTIVTEGLFGNAKGLAVDWVHDAIYWASSGTVQMATLDGTDHVVIFNDTNGKDLNNIIVDPYYKKLFWLNDKTVMSSGLQGEDLNVVEHMRSESIAIDLHKQMIYMIGYLQQGDTVISMGRSSYDGTNFEVMLTNSEVERIFGLGVIKHVAYWVGHNGSNIDNLYKVPIPRTARLVNATKVVYIGEAVHSIKLHSPKLQTPSRNYPCWLKNCSHPKLCVLTHKLSAECRCPKGWFLGEDSRTCLESAQTPTTTEMSIANSTKSTPADKTLFGDDVSRGGDDNKLQVNSKIKPMLYVLAVIVVLLLLGLGIWIAKNKRVHTMVVNFRKPNESELP